MYIHKYISIRLYPLAAFYFVRQLTDALQTLAPRCLCRVSNLRIVEIITSPELLYTHTHRATELAFWSVHRQTTVRRKSKLLHISLNCRADGPSRGVCQRPNFAQSFFPMFVQRARLDSVNFSNRVNLMPKSLNINSYIITYICISICMYI